MTSDQIVELVQQLDQVKTFLEQKTVLDSSTTIPTSDADLSAVHKTEVRMRTGNNFLDSRKCGRCGGKWHTVLKNCPAINAECRKCHKSGHFARVCKTLKSKETHFNEIGDQEANESSYEVFHNHSNLETDADTCHIKIDGVKCLMEKDSGAARTLISEKMWEDLGKPTLKKATGRMLSYDNHEMLQLGVLDALIELNYKFVNVQLPIIRCSKKFGLLGRDLLPEIHQNIHNSTPDNNYTRLLGISGTKIEIKLKPGTSPIELPARELPLALKER